MYHHSTQKNIYSPFCGELDEDCFTIRVYLLQMNVLQSNLGYPATSYSDISIIKPAAILQCMLSILLLIST